MFANALRRENGIARGVKAKAGCAPGELSQRRAVPFSQQDLEGVLTNIEAGPIQDPQPWFDWMDSRLTPEQAARVREAWSKRSTSLSGE